MSLDDNGLIRLFLPLLTQGLADLNITVNVLASAQPTQEGVPSTPTLFFQKFGARRYGYPRSSYVWDELNAVQNYVLKYYLESTFKFMALSRANPSDSTLPTASDILDAAATVLQSDNVVYALGQSGVGILRIVDEPTPYFVDDQNKFEQAPTFDATFTHAVEFSRPVNSVSVVNPGIYRV